MKAKKSLGQNFLVDKTVINNIVGEMSLTESDLVVEIGPGRGALTRELKISGASVLAYELDTDLKSYLDQLIDDKVVVKYQDILKSNIREDIANYKYDKLYIVGNLPYYITTPIVEYIIEQNLEFERFVIMVQKEVADRFMAKEKSKDYGYFTLLLKYYFDVQKVCDVSKNCFVPAPKVESAVISFTRREDRPDVDIVKYKEFLKQVFRQKRKTLKNNLSDYDWHKIKVVLDKYEKLDNVRAEELSEEIIVEIFKVLN